MPTDGVPRHLRATGWTVRKLLENAKKARLPNGITLLANASSSSGSTSGGRPKPLKRTNSATSSFCSPAMYHSSPVAEESTESWVLPDEPPTAFSEVFDISTRRVLSTILPSPEFPPSDDEEFYGDNSETHDQEETDDEEQGDAMYPPIHSLSLAMRSDSVASQVPTLSSSISTAPSSPPSSTSSPSEKRHSSSTMASSSSSASSYSRPVSLSTFPNPPGVSSSSFITSVDEEPAASTSSLPAPLSLTLSLPSPGLADLRASFLSTSTPSGSPLIRPLPPVPGRGGPAAFAYGHGRSMSDASSPAPLSSRSRAIRALPVPPQNTGSSSSSASSSSTIQEEPRSRPTTIPPPPPPKEEESTQKKIDKDGYPPLPPIPPHAFYHHAHPITNGSNTLPLRTKRSKSKLHLNTHVYVSPSARAHYDNFTAAQQQQLDSPTVPFTASTARPPSSAWTLRGGGGSGTQTPRAGPGSVAMSRSNSLARSRSRKARSTKGKSAGSGLRVAVGAKDDAASLFGFPYAYEDDGRWVEGDSPSGRTEIDWGALEDALVLADDGFVMDGYEYAMPEFGYAFDDIGVGIRSTEAAAARHHLV